jgi:hypothetical protein
MKMCLFKQLFNASVVMQKNGINYWWVYFASPQFRDYNSPTIVGLQYLILPILDKPNMGLFWVVLYWCVIWLFILYFVKDC